MTDEPRSQPPRSHAFGQLLGLRMDQAAAGVCHAHLEAREDHFNPHGVMHGGVLFSLADTSMGMALYTVLAPGETCATIEVKMNFLRPVAAGRVSCVTRVLRRGRTTAVLESTLHCGDEPVAVALGTYAILPLPPAPSEASPP